MRLLYKYYSVNEYSLENLRKNVVCFSDFLGFNDPFEGVGHFYYDATSEEQEYWDSIGSSALKYLSEGAADDSKELLGFKHRIFCVTEKNDHPLMWAHYAGSHTGFCVGYAEEDIRKISDKFDKVEYEQDPRMVDVTQLNMDEVEALLYVKSKEWNYEEEWRAIYTLKSNDVVHLNPQIEKEPNKLYVLHGFAAMGNLEVLAAEKYIVRFCEPKVIYLGLKMKQEDKTNLIEIVEGKPVSIFQMSQQLNSFKLASCQIR